MRQESVTYTCDQCGVSASEDDALSPRSSWRHLRFGGIEGADVELDERHLCSFRCARLAMISMCNELQRRELR